MQEIIQNWRGGLALKIVLTFGLVGLGDVLFFQRGLSAGYFGFFFLALLLALIISRPAVRRDWRSWTAIVPAGAYALAMSYDASLLSWTMFWIAAGVATMLPATATFDDGWRWFQRLFYHGIASCFGPLIDARKVSRKRQKRPTPDASFSRSIRVLALPLIGSAVIVALFSVANPILEMLVLSIQLPEANFPNVLRLMLWLALFTAIWSILRPRLPRHFIGTFDGSGDLGLPGVSVSSVRLSLVAFNLLFALQNLMDAAWLWGLMALPEGMTLAQYAHRGAYPLIATALLAALFVLVTLRPGSTTARVPAIRAMVILWIGQNLFLVASSALRTFDYIDAYSLTRLRIAALAWMGLVGLGLVLICWRMLRERSASWLINTNMAAAVLLLSACCFIDLGAVAAQWNVRHAREVDGNGARIDLCYLGELGGSALLPLIALEQHQLPGDLNNRVRIVRQRVHARLIDSVADGGWTWRNQQRLAEAARLLGPTTRSRAEGDYDCAGRVIPPAAPVVLVEPGENALPTASPNAHPLTGKSER